MYVIRSHLSAVAVLSCFCLFSHPTQYFSLPASATSAWIHSFCAVAQFQAMCWLKVVCLQKYVPGQYNGESGDYNRDGWLSGRDFVGSSATASRFVVGFGQCVADSRCFGVREPETFLHARGCCQCTCTVCFYPVSVSCLSAVALIRFISLLVRSRVMSVCPRMCDFVSCLPFCPPPLLPTNRRLFLPCPLSSSQATTFLRVFVVFSRR